MKRNMVVSVLLLTTSVLFAAKKFWEEQPYTEWPAAQAQKMLQDSPWASTQTFGSLGASGARTPTGGGTPGFDSPVPEMGNPSGGDVRVADQVSSRMYMVRFQSAAPIRMALARLGLLRGGVSLEQAQQFVDNPPGTGEIVVMLSVAPGQERTELDRGTTELLKNETYLVLKKSKKRIQLQQYLTPSEAGGVEAVFIFPRQENGQELISLEEEEVRFICEFSSQTKLNRKFKLKDMVFQGKLEL